MGTIGLRSSKPSVMMIRDVFESLDSVLETKETSSEATYSPSIEFTSSPSGEMKSPSSSSSQLSRKTYTSSLISEAQRRFLEMVNVSSPEDVILSSFSMKTPDLNAFLFAIYWEIIQFRTRKLHICNEYLINIDDPLTQKVFCRICDESLRKLVVFTSAPLSYPLLSVIFRLLTIGKWKPSAHDEVALNGKVSNPMLWKPLMTAALHSRSKPKIVEKCLVEANALLFDNCDNAFMLAVRPSWQEMFLPFLKLFHQFSEASDQEAVEKIPRLALNLIVSVHFHLLKGKRGWLVHVVSETVCKLNLFAGFLYSSSLLISILNLVMSHNACFFLSTSHGLGVVENFVDYLDFVLTYIFSKDGPHIDEAKKEYTDFLIVERALQCIEESHLLDLEGPIDFKDAKSFSTLMNRLDSIKQLLKSSAALFSLLNSLFSSGVFLSSPEFSALFSKFGSTVDLSASAAIKRRDEILSSISKMGHAAALKNKSE